MLVPASQAQAEQRVSCAAERQYSSAWRRDRSAFTAREGMQKEGSGTRVHMPYTCFMQDVYPIYTYSTVSRMPHETVFLILPFTCLSLIQRVMIYK